MRSGDRRWGGEARVEQIAGALTDHVESKGVSVEVHGWKMVTGDKEHGAWTMVAVVIKRSQPD